MPTLYYQVESAGTEILQTVTNSVISGLLEELDLTRSFEDAIYPMSSFMARSDYSNGNGQPKLSTNRCDVDATYILDKAQVPWPTESPYTTTALGRRSNSSSTYTPILVDPDAGILMEHQTVASAIEMVFNLRFTTFDEALKAFDRIQARYKGSLIQTPFHLRFSYPVTFKMFEYLTTVFEAKAAYKDKSFLDWINDVKKTEISWDIRKTEIAEPDADKALMIRCQQLNCLMQFTMDQKEPEVVKIDELPELFQVSFNTTIQFGRPTIVSVKTPVSVDNTVLPAELFSSIGAETHYTADVAGVYQDLMCHEFMQRSYGNFNFAHQLVRMPAYDDWLQVDQQYVFYQYRPFLIIHLTLDGPTTVIDLKDLGQISLHPTTKRIMKETGSDILNYGGLFNIGVYANDLRLAGDLVTISDDLVLTITSDRKDKVYHLVISETTELTKTDPKWDRLLVKYRYFFPLTIERNLKTLIDKRYFYINYSNGLLSLIGKLAASGKLKPILSTMIGLGEVHKDIFAYTQNVSQLADFMAYTQSLRSNYKLPTGNDPTSQLVKDYYTSYASVESRSLLVVFLEMCLVLGHTDLDNLPTQYLDPNSDMYPYYSGQGGFYGYNTPVRIIDTKFTV